MTNKEKRQLKDAILKKSHAKFIRCNDSSHLIAEIKRFGQVKWFKAGFINVHSYEFVPSEVNHFIDGYYWDEAVIFKKEKKLDVVYFVFLPDNFTRFVNLADCLRGKVREHIYVVIPDDKGTKVYK